MGVNVATDAAKPAVNAPVETAPAAAPAPAAPEIQLGEKVVLSAAHGRMIHPGTEQEFDQNKLSSVVHDWWTKLQYDAGKLVKAVL